MSFSLYRESRVISPALSFYIQHRSTLGKVLFFVGIIIMKIYREEAFCG